MWTSKNAPEGLTLNNPVQGKRGRDRMGATPISAVWGKEIVESSVPEGRALKRMNRTHHKKRKE